MAKLTKKQKEANAKLDTLKLITLSEASALIKEITNVKFDASSRFSNTFRSRSS